MTAIRQQTVDRPLKNNILEAFSSTIHWRGKKVGSWTGEVPGSKHDLFALAKKVAKEHVKPRLYQCCGTEDPLHADNIRFHDAVRKLPIDLTYEEGPGEHVWAYWDKMIQNALAWMLPTGKKP